MRRKKKEEWITAEDLMAKLNADPDYVDRRRRLDEEHARRVEEGLRAERPVLAALRRVGVNIASLVELMGYDVTLEPNVVDALIEQLTEIKDRDILDAIVRALIGARKAFDGQCLIRLFENTDDVDLRWVIGVTMVHARVTGISDWVARAVANPSYGMAREQMIRALPKLTSREKAIPALLAALDDIPGHTAYALGKIGRPSELPPLRRQLKKTHEHRWIKKEIERAIAKIEQRAIREKSKD